MKALFGGSFNPVHVGHLILARDVLETFGLEEVIFVPANLQPLKPKPLIPPNLRLHLLKVATRAERAFRVWDCELKRGGASYTVDTLKEFHRIYREKPLFIMGADSFASLHLWREPKEVLRLSRLLVLPRPGFEANVPLVLSNLGLDATWAEANRNSKHLPDADIVLFKSRILDVSSTEIRERLKAGKSISYLVPEAVEETLRRWWKDELQKDV